MSLATFFGLFSVLFVLCLCSLTFMPKFIWIGLCYATILTLIVLVWRPSSLLKLANSFLRKDVEDHILHKIQVDMRQSSIRKWHDEAKTPSSRNLSSVFDSSLRRRRYMEMSFQSAVLLSSPQISRTSYKSESSNWKRDVGSTSMVHEWDILGMDYHLKEIENKLKGGRSKLEIVTIVGVGGIGKTTLARQLLKDESIYCSFDICGWSTVSQDSCFRNIVPGLLKSANIQRKDKEGYLSNETLGKYLHESLRCKRYLIVMDDLWDVEIWDEVKRFLPHDGNGSRVIITTRLTEVARYANSGGSLHWIHYLNANDSQRLLNYITFGGENCPGEVREIRDEIAQSCKGLPLALVVIGQLLSRMNTANVWRSLAYGLNSVSTKDDKCMEILALSYYNLPQHLRPCFLYMGMFPQNYPVSVTKLIRLWAAEGFLEPLLSLSWEKLAEGYLEDLVGRNLILVDRRNSQGQIKRCKLHSVLHKLCLREAHREKFFFVINHQRKVRKQGIESYQRLVIHPSVLEHCSNINYNEEQRNSIASSLLVLGTNFDDPKPNTKWNYLHYRLLRVLDLLIVHLSLFPLEVYDILSLRYLALSFTGTFHTLISKLKNLQTIIHKDTSSHKDSVLPVEIWGLPKLQHLCVPEIGIPVPPGGNSLRVTDNLQTLAEVINLSFGNEILDIIRSLKKLVVSYDVKLQSFKGWVEHRLQNIALLYRLEILKLSITNVLVQQGVLPPTNLALPDSLKKLILRGCRFSWENFENIGYFPNLEVLELSHNACQGEEWKPERGKFPALKSLKLKYLNLLNWEADFTEFPYLQRLVIKSCRQLHTIPYDLRALQRIKFIDCQPMMVISFVKLQMVNRGLEIIAHFSEKLEETMVIESLGNRDSHKCFKLYVV